MKNTVSRRNFVRMGLGTVGGFASVKALGKACGVGTGSQALGPFFPNEGTPDFPVRENPSSGVPIHLANDNDLTFVRGLDGSASGQVVLIKGKVTDPLCRPIPHATIVIWQASASGRYNHRGDAENQSFQHPVTGKMIERSLDTHFQYWGQAQSDEHGEYQFKTVIPGFYPADLQSGWFRPPHIHFMVSAMGYPQLVTQLYFSGDKIPENEWIQELNARDLLLQSGHLNEEQRSALVVQFRDNPGSRKGEGLLGEFNITLNR